MSTNFYFIIILAIIVGNYLLRLLVELLNIRAVGFEVPLEFKNHYDSKRYTQSQRYLRENTLFSLIQKTVTTGIMLFFILSGAFNFIDQCIRLYVNQEIVQGLLFAGVLFFFFQIVDIPFSLYHTFVLEEKYGFNRTTPKTFIFDILKSWLITIIVGSGVLAVIIWFFMKTGSFAWIWCWVAVTLFQVFLLFIAPVVIMPLFNKFTPLAAGDLKTAIQDYARSQEFKLKGIFTMDGSKRSSKANAFFTGFGKYRRIALFDTLIAKHSLDELVSILAHEIGHYKKKHVLKGMLLSICTTGLMFFVLSLFINNPSLFAVFKMQNLSIYASLFFFSFLYTPISMLLSIGETALSRRHEYEADRFAVETSHKPEAFIEALKKLTVDNLSNLTPHPAKVVLDYSHPPVLKRIEAIRSRSSQTP